jgi:hypothetical protein
VKFSWVNPKGIKSIWLGQAELLPV